MPINWIYVSRFFAFFFCFLHRVWWSKQILLQHPPRITLFSAGQPYKRLWAWTDASSPSGLGSYRRLCSRPAPDPLRSLASRWGAAPCTRLGWELIWNKNQQKSTNKSRKCTWIQLCCHNNGPVDDAVDGDVVIVTRCHVFSKTSLKLANRPLRSSVSKITF